MLTRERRILNGNLAFVPLLLLLKFFGFRMGDAGTNKIFRQLYSLSLLIVLLLLSTFIQYSVGQSVVVAAVTYINARCIHFTLIIIYIRSAFSRKSLETIFRSFDSIDDSSWRAFKVKVRNDNSKCLVLAMIVLLFVSAFWGFVFDLLQYKNFNVGQLVHAMLVFVFSVKILFYCMLCTSIKARFSVLNKCLRDSKSAQSKIVAKATKLVLVKSDENLSQFKYMSLIFDEVLEVISLMNDSFSTLLSSAFGK
jgi:7tm Chemosensory receptor